MKTRLFFFWVSAMIIASCAGGGNENTKSESAPAENKKEMAAAPVDNKAAGEKTFKTYCITCHGIDGKLGLNGAKDLSLSELTLDERITQVTKGKGLMTPFEGILTEDQIKQVAEFTFTFKGE
ncbi:MAG: cytochrome c [Saprospiraceae bacterium]|nr:cytochrome c [Saprospiraceae bacterium]